MRRDLDSRVEGLSRGLAARSSRRTFLGRMGKVAVLVAGGPALATVLAEQAEARVCGQSGVSPKCGTFDCNGPGDVWGWCWYASPGCCANGGLKKICDCCRTGYPNVHGYCPSGTNIRCIVESCGADPRVLYIPIERLAGASAEALALARSERLPAGRGGTAVLGDGEDTLSACLAGPVASAVGGPLLLSRRSALSPSVVPELRRLNITDVKIVGPGLTLTLDDELRAADMRPERLHDGADLSSASVQVARFVMARTGVRRAWCVGLDGSSAAAAPAAAAIAGAKGGPVLLGVDAAIAAGSGRDATALTYLVGPEVAGRAGAVPGGFPLRSGTRNDLAIELASLAVDVEGLRALTLAFVPDASAGVAAGMLGGEASILLHHPDASLGGALAGWVRDHRGAVARAVLGGDRGRLSDGGTYDLQSALHGFDTQFLQGVGGQGLPVRAQPLDERVLGQARRSGPLPAPEKTYWSGRARVPR